ncbi:MAG: FAD binding domain-containing protein [Pseudomonadota bacterium]
MKPAPFDYHVVESRLSALALLTELSPEARILAGGQSLIPELNTRQRILKHVIDINAVEEFKQIDFCDDELTIGAIVRQADLEHNQRVRQDYSYLPDLLALIASDPIKHRGTLVGSVAHGDPSAELPALAVCLNATIHLESQSTQRVIRARDFYTAPFSTAAAATELITRIRFPRLAANQHLGVAETQRRHNGVAIAGAICCVTVAESFHEVLATVYATGHPPVSQDLTTEFSALSINDRVEIEAAAKAAMNSLRFTGDVLASADYRRHACGVLLNRAIADACLRAQNA